MKGMKYLEYQICSETESCIANETVGFIKTGGIHMLKKQVIHRQRKNNINPKDKVLLKIISLFIMVCLLCSDMFLTKASAVTSGYYLVNVQVNYLEGTAIVTQGPGGSTKFYMSTDNGRNWQVLESNVVDITPYLKSRENTIYFKGNRDTAQTPVVLQGEDNTLKAVYQAVNGEGQIVISNINGPVEYRNGANGAWKTLAGYTISTALYEYSGATLNIRTMATVQKRAGRIVNVRVPKKPSAPGVSLDGSKFEFIGLKAGQTQYRVGDSTVWQTFAPSDKRIRTLDLATLFGTTLNYYNPLPGGTVEFRTPANGKNVASSIKLIEVPRQETAPATINLYGTTLTIADSSNRKAYEYTVVEPGKILDLKTARWSPINNSRPVKIRKVSPGSKIYVRVRSYIDRTTQNVIPASTCREFTVTTWSY